MAVTVEGDNGFYGKYGTFGKDFDGDYIELGWGTTIAEIDFGIAAILNSDDLSIRQYLLAWLFSTLNGEHGFGLFVARKGFEKYKDPIFLLLQKKSYRKLSRGYLNFLKKVLIRLVPLKVN